MWTFGHGRDGCDDGLLSQNQKDGLECIYGMRPPSVSGFDMDSWAIVVLEHKSRSILDIEINSRALSPHHNPDQLAHIICYAWHI